MADGAVLRLVCGCSRRRRIVLLELRKQEAGHKDTKFGGGQRGVAFATLTP